MGMQPEIYEWSDVTKQFTTILRFIGNGWDELLLLAGCQKLGLQAGGFNPTDEY